MPEYLQSLKHRKSTNTRMRQQLELWFFATKGIVVGREILVRNHLPDCKNDPRQEIL